MVNQYPSGLTIGLALGGLWTKQVSWATIIWECAGRLLWLTLLVALAGTSDAVGGDVSLNCVKQLLQQLSLMLLRDLI